MAHTEKGSTNMVASTVSKGANKSGQYLRTVRVGLGLSRRQAADLIGCTPQTIGRYERQGISGHIRYSRVSGLCEAYGISADYLFTLMMQPAE